MYLVFYVCRQRRNRFNMDHMPKVFGVFMLGLFFLRFTGILRSQKNEEIRKTEVVILKKNKIWKLPDNIRSTVLMCD